MVMKKVAMALGGNVKKMLTGSAPLSKEVMNFFKVAFSSQFYEAYGMTETCGASIGTASFDNMTGHVGGPQVNVKVRLRDVVEAGYLTTDKPMRGEVCFYGSSIMEGYFNQPDKTNEAVINGWMHSGDVAVIHENGQIVVIDRVKNIFKLSQGEYISPEKVENIYIQSEYLAQTFCHGDSLKDFIVMVGVVEPGQAAKFAGTDSDKEETLKDPEFIMAIMKDLYKLAEKSKLNGLEKPKQIFLTYEPFAADGNEILTTTMKMKRNVAKVYFKQQIEDMYAAGAIDMKKK